MFLVVSPLNSLLTVLSCANLWAAGRSGVEVAGGHRSERNPGLVQQVATTALSESRSWSAKAGAEGDGSRRVPNSSIALNLSIASSSFVPPLFNTPPTVCLLLSHYFSLFL